MTMRPLVPVLALMLLAPPSATVAAPAGKVVIAQGADPSALDVMDQEETPASNVGAQIFDTLVERSRKLELVPALAAELPKPISPTVWEIELRKGVRFHDGEEFNAESVKFSLERVTEPAIRGSANFRPIERVEIVGPYTVRVHTSRPWPIFIAALTQRQASMYPPRAYAGKDRAFISRNPIGTGPYRFVHWAKDEEILLEANTRYWRGAPRIKTVVFRAIRDDAVRVAALQNGAIDLAAGVPPRLAAIIANHPKLFLATAPSIRTMQLMFSTHRYDSRNRLVGRYQGPTADRRVRTAIALAIDVDAIIKGVLDGKARRVATLLPSTFFGYDPALRPVKQDVAAAKELLAEAGYPNGVDLTFNAPEGRYVGDRAVAEAVTAQLNAAGIRTTLRTFAFVNYLNNMVYLHKAGPMWLIGWGQPTMDAEGVYVPLFRSATLLSNYHNAEFDRLVDEAQATMNSKKRLALYRRINRLWIDDVAAIPLYQPLDLYGVSRRLNWKARGDEQIEAFEMSLKDGT